LPNQNYYELCAVYLLEYEKILKGNKIRTTELKDLVKIPPAKTSEGKNENQVGLEKTEKISKKEKSNMKNLRKKVYITFIPFLFSLAQIEDKRLSN
jgi:hypothetical protein